MSRIYLAATYDSLTTQSVITITIQAPVCRYEQHLAEMLSNILAQGNKYMSQS